MLLSTEHGSWGLVLRGNQVGTLLLGGKPRTELSVPAPAEGAVTAGGTSPRVRVVLLPAPADKPVAAVASLRSRAAG